MIAIFSIAYKQGDPYRLIYGTNAEGVTCGRGNYTGKRLIYYPRLHDDIQDAWKTAALNAWKQSASTPNQMKQFPLINSITYVVAESVHWI